MARTRNYKPRGERSEYEELLESMLNRCLARGLSIRQELAVLVHAWLVEDGQSIDIAEQSPDVAGGSVAARVVGPTSRGER